VVFLGHVISGEGIFMDSKKVEAILNWESPTNVTKIHSLSLQGIIGDLFKGFLQ
jgi:hypothetical protein